MEDKLSSEDIWSDWLKHRRFGGDENYQKNALKLFRSLADKIVEKANIQESSVVLDLGSGDGLVALVALDMLGKHGKLIISDISENALSIPKNIFKDKPDPRVEFLVSDIQDLSQLPKDSIDRIVMRSVLLYAEDKPKVFKEMFRILRKGGRATILEPINQRHVELEQKYFRGFNLDTEPLLSVKPLLQRVKDESKRTRPTNILGYNEHDLVQMSINMGFRDIELEYKLSVTEQARYESASALLDVAPNPLAKTLREIMKQVLNQDEYNVVEKTLMKVWSNGVFWTNAECLLILNK